MIRYIITTHAHLPGVGLSKPGHWGGMRHPDDAAAAQAAEEDAKGKPFHIERQHIRRKLHEVR